MYRISSFVRHFALALLSGAVIATLWVNLRPDSYYDFIEWHILDLVLPQWIWAGSVSLTPFMIVADMLMALFFFFIGKELWEALVLERGALSGARAILPASMVIGGMIGATALWLGLSALLQTAEEAVPGGGWTVPLGTDTVLVWLFARPVFGRGNPALHLVLLLAIATDIAALLVLGFSNPNLSIRLLWLILPLAVVLLVRHFHRPEARAGESERARRARLALWPWVIAGAVSWFGVAASGLPASLGLLPIIPAIPRADRSFGIFAEAEGFLNDPLNRLAHALILPLVAVLFLFGLIRGGVDLAAFQPTTVIVLGSFWIGRPLGMMIAAALVLILLRPGLTPGIHRREIVLSVMLLGIGFTVPAIAVQAALPGGAMQEAARMGLALSILAGPIALLLSRIWRG